MIGGAFGEESLVWAEDATLRRFFAEANPLARKTFGFTLILREGAAFKTAFGVLGGI